MTALCWMIGAALASGAVDERVPSGDVAGVEALPEADPEAADADLEAADAAPTLTRDMLWQVATGRSYRSAVMRAMRSAEGPSPDPVRAITLKAPPISMTRYELRPSPNPPPSAPPRRPRASAPVDLLPIDRAGAGALGLVPGATSRPGGLRMAGGAPTVYLDGAVLTPW